MFERRYTSRIMFSRGVIAGKILEFIVLTSILLQGTAIPIVAKWLNLED